VWTGTSLLEFVVNAEGDDRFLFRSPLLTFVPLSIRIWGFGLLCGSIYNSYV
jgi:hypothetical protein